MLGDEIGKGAYGRVYKGLDLENGDFVAIKQVSLENIPQEDLNIIMVRTNLFSAPHVTYIACAVCRTASLHEMRLLLGYKDQAASAEILEH
jgi:serine/threonine protein kinase